MVGHWRVIIAASYTGLLPIMPFMGPSVPPLMLLTYALNSALSEINLTTTVVDATLVGVLLPCTPDFEGLGKTLDTKSSLVLPLGPQRWYHLYPSASVSLLSYSVSKSYPPKSLLN